MHNTTHPSRGGARYAVYADLSCQLTDEERSAVFEALDAIVPDSGCVGRESGASDNDEVYFCVEAFSEEEAIELAARYMLVVGRESGLKAGYALTVQKIPRR